MIKPVFEHKAKKLPKYIEDSVVLEMLDDAKKDKKRNYLILLMLWRTGLRVSELVNLKKRDIQNDIIFVRQGKFGKDRVIPLEKELGNILGFYLDGLHPKDKLFKISDRQVRNIVYKYTPDGYNVHPHTFRHSFAVHCLKSGMNLRNLQKILGHSSLTCTQVYLDITGADIIDDFDKVEW